MPFRQQVSGLSTAATVHESASALILTRDERWRRRVVVDAWWRTGHIADELFPTCMVCEVYLKLPAYTLPQVLRDKLLTAIREGQEFFAFD